MKKIFLGVIFVLCLTGSVFCNELRVIPYPEGLDTKSEGASSLLEKVDHKDSIYFDTKVDYFTLTSNENRIMLSHYPTYQQSTEYTCGPAAALTVLYYFGVTKYTEESLSVEMKTKPVKGTTTKNMLEFFKKIGWETDSSLKRAKFEDYESFAKFVIENLKNGIPILVENVEWGGHWRVIIGFDSMGTYYESDDVLIMMDPYDVSDHKQDGYVLNNAERFFSMWFDHSLFPKDQAEQPFIIAYPKKDK